MAFDYDKVVKDSFKHLGTDNPLKKLGFSERRLLVALLDTYLRPSKEMYDAACEPWEQAAAVALEAGQLAKKMRLNVFEADLGKRLSQLLVGPRDLPDRLEAFSVYLRAILDRIEGKSGHKGKVFRNRSLVLASEFVCRKTGKHYDEHLAELIQSVGVLADEKLQEDISGDAIRKKRNHFKETYPLIYRDLLAEVEILVARGKSLS
jgi:hypothetical protein